MFCELLWSALGSLVVHFGALWEVWGITLYCLGVPLEALGGVGVPLWAALECLWELLGGVGGALWAPLGVLGECGASLWAALGVMLLNHHACAQKLASWNTLPGLPGPAEVLP